MVIFLLPNSHIKVAQLRLDKRLQFGYNSVTEKILDKIENDAKIVNRTNVCYKEENQMEERLENVLKKATPEQLEKLLIIAELIVQQDLKTVLSVHQLIL